MIKCTLELKSWARIVAPSANKAQREFVLAESRISKGKDE